MLKAKLHSTGDSERGLTDEEQHHQVGDEEGAAAVLVGGEREPPDVPQADRHCHAGEQELHRTAPLVPLLAARLLLRAEVSDRVSPLLVSYWGLRSESPGCSASCNEKWRSRIVVSC